MEIKITCKVPDHVDDVEKFKVEVIRHMSRLIAENGIAPDAKVYTNIVVEIPMVLWYLVLDGRQTNVCCRELPYEGVVRMLRDFVGYRLFYKIMQDGKSFELKPGETLCPPMGSTVYVDLKNG